MKKFKLCSLLALLALSSCAGGGGTSEENSVPALSSGETSLSEDATPVTNVRWTAEVDKLLKEALGEFVDNLPLLEADSYEGVNDTLSSGVTYTRITCFTEDAEDAAKVYRVGLKLGGWAIELDESTGYYQGNVRVAFDTLLMITFSDVVRNGKPAVVIAAWVYHDKVTEFPSEKVKDFLGIEIPALKADGYSFVTGNIMGYDILEIDCYGANEADCLDYLDLMMEKGWSVSDAGTCYILTETTLKICNQFYFYDTEAAQMDGWETDRPVAMMMLYKY